MTATSRRETSAEVAVVKYLRARGYVRMDHHDPHGDGLGHVAVATDLVVHVKDRSPLDLAAWLDAVGQEAGGAEARLGVVIQRRRGRPDVGDWYALLSVSDLLTLLQEHVIAAELLDWLCGRLDQHDPRLQEPLRQLYLIRKKGLPRPSRQGASEDES